MYWDYHNLMCLFMLWKLSTFAISRTCLKLLGHSARPGDWGWKDKKERKICLSCRSIQSRLRGSILLWVINSGQLWQLPFHRGIVSLNWMAQGFLFSIFWMSIFWMSIVFNFLNVNYFSSLDMLRLEVHHESNVFFSHRYNFGVSIATFPSIFFSSHFFFQKRTFFSDHFIYELFSLSFCLILFFLSQAWILFVLDLRHVVSVTILLHYGATVP